MVSDLALFYQRHAARHHRAVVFWQPESHQPFSEIHQWLEQLHALHVHASGNFRNYLGTEQSIVFYDARNHWSCNALVGLSGTLIGQGLLLVAVDKTSLQRPSMQHWLSALTEANVYYCQQDHELIALLKAWQLKPTTVRFKANSEQQQVLSSLLQLKGHQAGILYAPRGRGKTTTLAHWANQPHTFARRFVCAPSKIQAALYLHNESDIRFIPPDQLALHAFNLNDLLIIDEAATLPIAAQNAALAFPGTLVLATTTEGYEYAGRGFIIRFVNELKERFELVQTYELQQPMRWASHDPVEIANTIAFGLYPNEDVSASLSNHKAKLSEAKSQVVDTECAGQTIYSHRHCSSYTPAERFAIFRLLVEAHYQTSPNDIQRLLDDPCQQLVAQWQTVYNERALLSTAWLSAEGPINPELIEPITQGKRRPAGNLLPQAYAYYGKQPALAAMRHLRVVRITVAIPHQGAGLGSALLDYIYNWATQEGYDALGTSFGMNSELLSFWQKNNWQPIRVGHKPDPASRLPSAIYARPISPCSAKYLHTLSTFLRTELNYRVSTGHLQTSLATQIAAGMSNNKCSCAAIKQRWQLLGLAFANGELNFLDYQPWLAAALSFGWVRLDSYEHMKLLEHAIQDSGDLVALAIAMNLAGKKEALLSLRTVCTELHQ